jgi:hypothetical protein
MSTIVQDRKFNIKFIKDVLTYKKERDYIRKIDKIYLQTLHDGINPFIADENVDEDWKYKILFNIFTSEKGYMLTFKKYTDRGYDPCRTVIDKGIYAIVQW